MADHLEPVLGGMKSTGHPSGSPKSANETGLLVLRQVIFCENFLSARYSRTSLGSSSIPSSIRSWKRGLVVEAKKMMQTGQRRTGEIRHASLVQSCPRLCAPTLPHFYTYLIAIRLLQMHACVRTYNNIFTMDTTMHRGHSHDRAIICFRPIPCVWRDLSSGLYEKPCHTPCRSRLFFPNCPYISKALDNNLEPTYRSL